MKRKIIAATILIICVFIIMTGISYIPQKIVNVQAKDVSKIEILDGNTGKHLEITDDATIARIINNLNRIVFQKEKSAHGYDGSRFDTKIYIHNKLKESLIINSEDTIQYKGFFYKSTNVQIEYEYLEELLETVPSN
ncbi:hypothetical protein [Solibacillus sp. CAU 1738]|uniref:hypothetical protein n=1 Tax=Solibacillus sp. CAU 1738 TaxID=3140363 RepID=UPI003260709A